MGMVKLRISDNLDRDAIIRGLGSTIFSRNLILHERIDSTNRLARELALKGAEEGTVVLAEEQTTGKGRLDRVWLSPGHTNLLFTIILRPTLNPDDTFILTMILAVAVIDSVKEMSGLDILIKWPNDLCIHQKKLGGILTEFSVRDKRLRHVILGLGLNVNWRPGGNDDIMYPVTSILAESGHMISRNELLSGILKRFEEHYQETLSGKEEDFYMKWNQLSMVIGKDVEIISPDEIVRGKAVRIDRQGALILKDSLGEEKRILTGDVSLRLK
jgi:BirA family biotin operon repressor/biotin-[acetyl-CoA-carboxylase] ligase